MTRRECEKKRKIRRCYFLPKPQTTIKHLTAPHTLSLQRAQQQRSNCIYFNIKQVMCTQGVLVPAVILFHHSCKVHTMFFKPVQKKLNKFKKMKKERGFCCELPKCSPNYLRVVIVAETFSEGVMVYFQLSDLCGEHREHVGKGKREGVSNYDRETREQLDRRSLTNN